MKLMPLEAYLIWAHLPVVAVLIPAWQANLIWTHLPVVAVLIPAWRANYASAAE
jgi:hypothetical protein